MSSDFYRKFEEKYRGSREVIKSRLHIYLPFVELLKVTNKEIKAVDLGCGRGEWLELLRDENVDANGVDLDEGMLSACQEKNLSVELIDALQYIKSLPDKSQDIVSAFHLVEHITFENLQILVEESQRVLKPNGLMILETPNAENIVVATRNFYLDPTHVRPIPSQLLAFLSEYHGFYRTKVLRLQESPELATGKTVALLDVLDGVSPDYSIVAQKAGPEEDLEKFVQVFEKEYGLTLESLANQYDLQLGKKLEMMDQVDQDIVNSRSKIENLQNDLTDMQAGLSAHREDLINIRTDLSALREDLTNMRADLAALREDLKTVREERDKLRMDLIKAQKELLDQRNLHVELELLRKELATNQAELESTRAQTENYRLQYVNILYSLSYRITAPLRGFYRLLSRLRRGIGKFGKVKAENLPDSTAETTVDAVSKNDIQYFDNLFNREIEKRRKK